MDRSLKLKEKFFYLVVNTGRGDILLKKNIILFILLFIVSMPALSQPKVDSLLRLCDKAPEKQKTALYLELSHNLRKDTLKSNSYARQAFKLAEKLKQLPEQAKSYYFIGETNYYARDFSGAIPYYQKAIPLFELLKDSFNLTNCYNSIGLCYHGIYQGERAIEQYINALRTCENDKEYTAEIISNIAMAHAKMNNYIEAIANYRKALNINTSIRDSSSMAVNYNGLGDTYSNMNKPDSAITNFLKAHYLFKKLKNKGNQAITLTNIATIYPNYPDSLNKAMAYFNEAWKIFKELGQNHFEAEIRQGNRSYFI